MPRSSLSPTFWERGPSLQDRDSRSAENSSETRGEKDLGANPILTSRFSVSLFPSGGTAPLLLSCFSFILLVPNS